MREGVLVSIMALAFVTIGCGRSPDAPPRTPGTPVKMLRAPDGHLVAVPTKDDPDGDLIAVAPGPSKDVEYVRIEEWQAPTSVQQFEAQVIPRGAASPGFIEFPKLTLHRPIPETRVLGRWVR